MSEWYWKVIALKAAFVLTCVATYLRAEDNVQKLPFCNPHNNINGPSLTNDLVLVSTLDGKLTAFSTDNGLKAWTLETQPLLSSNLHHVELTSGGKWVRLVPSLRGTLYSLSGDTIEPLPFDAEQLLSASFKYSDDLVIAGARETLWLGVDTASGSIIYECGSSGCNSEQQTASMNRDVLVLRRHSNTLRALDPRSGIEKWNFSVAEHNLALSRRECEGGNNGPSKTAIAIGVAMPEGVVAVRRPGDSGLLWRQKLDAPVANMWRLHDGSLQNIDVMWEATQSLVEGNGPIAPPSLYIGVHDRQLYIQESILYSQKLETAVVPKNAPWKVRHSRPLLDNDEQDKALTVQDAEPNTLSLITLYGKTEYNGNHGFFLYLQETCDQAIQVTPELDGPDVVPPNASEELEHHHIHVHVYSLWFWWKEVLLIAVSSALLMNLMFWPRFIAPMFRPSTPLPINQKENIVVERYYERPVTNEYSGRYENDFTPLRCLGKGGFGVVFEARNNIDHCSYAVKRITLPRKESKRERVLREVRALAKLEHENIVRYFNAWLEEPPPLWQQQRDAAWIRELEGAGVSYLSDEYSATSPHPKSAYNKSNSVTLDLQKCDECVDAFDFEKQLAAEKSKRQRSLSCNDSFSIVFDDDATKDPSSSQKASTVHSKVNSSDITPDILSKNLSNLTNHTLSKRKSENEDSFVVFAHTQDLSGQNQSEARNAASVNKRLEMVKEMDIATKTDSSKPSKKKKKGHRRHWSLDMCVREEPVADSKMYLYIQMQLCRRDSLHDWLRHNRTPAARIDKVKVLFSQIVSAVEYVHLAGLIHRDLKPSNIFFAPDGRVKVGDFGLVTAMADGSQDGEPTNEIDAHARHTYRVGTHLYMSPEQLLGRSYSYKVDIYSLGLILYELLEPFGTEAERVNCLMRARNSHYPHQFSEKHPQEMEVLKLMLSEDPSQRPTAMGVKARAPLFQDTDEKWHFTLPPLAS